MYRRFRMLLLLSFSLSLLGAHPLLASNSILYSYQGPEARWGLAFSDFVIRGPLPLREGATVSVEFLLKNTTSSSIQFGRYGIFVAARDGAGFNRDFGHTFANQTLAPGATATIQAHRILDQPGPWKFWPAYYRVRFGWSPYPWHPARVEFNRLRYEPPYQECKTAETEPGVANAHAECNRFTGYLGLSSTAWIGTSAAEGVQLVWFNADEEADVTVTARIVFVGGAKTSGPAAFAGSYAVWSVLDELDDMEAIDEPLTWKSAGKQICSIAGLVAPGLPGGTVAQAIDAIATVADLLALAEELNALLEAGKAREHEVSFDYHAPRGFNEIHVGLRGQASGWRLGSGFTVLAGQVQSIEVEFH